METSNLLTDILADAVAGGADSVDLEFQSGGSLEIMFNSGNSGAGYIVNREKGRAIIASLHEERKKGRGRLRLNLHGKDYLVQVKTHDSFGETAYRLTFREAKR